jgi:hypothetical protein
MPSKLAGVCVFAFAGAQFLQPVLILQSKGSAPPHKRLQAPEPVLRIVDRSCRDCHTWNTQWPWYARISPLSWVIARDVERGREFLNFSEWSGYSRAQKLAFMAAISSISKQDRMPPAPYLIMHPEARLSDRDRSVIETWSRREFRRLATLHSRRAPAPKDRLMTRSVTPAGVAKRVGASSDGD